MPNSNIDTRKLVADLQQAKLVDFNVPAKSFVDVAHSHFGPGAGNAAADWNVIVSNHYVLVTGLSDMGKEKINPAGHLAGGHLAGPQV